MGVRRDRPRVRWFPSGPIHTSSLPGVVGAYNMARDPGLVGPTWFRRGRAHPDDVDGFAEGAAARRLMARGGTAYMRTGGNVVPPTDRVTLAASEGPMTSVTTAGPPSDLEGPLPQLEVCGVTLVSPDRRDDVARAAVHARRVLGTYEGTGVLSTRRLT